MAGKFMNDKRLEILDRYRDSARFYLKFNFGYLLIIGAILTALNLHDMVNIFLYVAEAGYLINTWLMIFLADMGILWLIQSAYSSNKNTATESSSKKYSIPIVKIARLQPIYHSIFIAVVANIGIFYANSLHEQESELYTIAMIQGEIEKLAKIDKTPENLEAIRGMSHIKRAIGKINKESYKYKQINNEDYELTYFGSDQQFNTKDDFMFNSKNHAEKLYMQTFAWRKLYI